MIPPELKALPQWVVWVPGTKAPHDAKTHGAAKVNEPLTWATYERAEKCWRDNPKRYAGIGFVFTAEDPFCGLDLDDCLSPEGVPYDRAWKLMERMASYTEISPSGRGVKIIVRATKPVTDCAKRVKWSDAEAGDLEVYDRSRYFTITGRGWPALGTIADRQRELDELCAKLWSVPVGQAGPLVHLNGHATNTPYARCLAYLKCCDDSISGQRGHDKALRAAGEAMRFGLSDAEALEVMRWWSAEKSGGEPWNEREIAHKIQDARKKCAAEGTIGIKLRTEIEAKPAVTIAPPPEPGAAASVKAMMGRIVSGDYYAAPWPWPTLTKLTQALVPGALTLLCGTPGVSKSFVVLHMARGWMEEGVPFAVFMMEEDRTYHLRRYLAILEGNSEMTELPWIKAHGPVVEAATDRHSRAMDEMGRHIYEAPDQRMSLMGLADWYETIAPKARVTVIDPVTAAATSDKRWLDDGQFVERVKTIARKNESSLVLMTHPKLGNRRGAPTLDDMAGGSDFPRFCQTVIVMANRDDSEGVECVSPFGRTVMCPNRVLHLRKCRNGRGTGSDIGYSFDGKTLDFKECGVIVRD